MRLTRTLETTRMRITHLDVTDTDAAAWLRHEVAARRLPYLLAHADDGVIWGRLAGEELLTSHEALEADPNYAAVSPPLRATTLRQARAFSESAELMLWRNDDGEFHARLIEDGPQTEGEGTQSRETLDEPQMLWGTEAVRQVWGFTVWREGAQGMLHAVPCTVGARPPRLGIRHYLADAPTACIELSRLTGLIPDDGGDTEALDGDPRKEYRP